MGATVILTTHDMGTAYEICDAVTVMYAGQVVEVAQPLGLTGPIQAIQWGAIYVAAALATSPCCNENSAARIPITTARSFTACDDMGRGICACARGANSVTAPAVASATGIAR